MEFIRPVYYSNVDRNAELSPVEILRYIQDSFAADFKSMGCDNETLRTNYGCMWVITKNRVRVTGPRFHIDDVMRINSRCVKAGKARCFMQTDFFDAAGRARISSLIECCVIDTATFRIRALDTIPFTPGDEPTDTRFELPELNELDTRSFTVTPLMIDYSKHFNNVQSLAVYIDSFDPATCAARFPLDYELVMKFSVQAMLGEELTMSRCTHPHGHGYTVKRPATGEEIVRATITLGDAAAQGE